MRDASIDRGLFFVFMQLDELDLLIPASEQGPIIVLFPLPEYALLASGRHAVEDRAHPRPCRRATSEGAPESKSKDVSIDQTEFRQAYIWSKGHWRPSSIH